MLKLNFPHIPRKISAPFVWYTEKIGLWSLLATLIVTNLYAKANLTPVYWEKLVTTMQFPFRLDSHIDLAQSLRKAGAGREAENELVYAQSLKSAPATNPKVLGTSTLDPEVLLNNWKNLTQNLTNQYAYWQNIVSEKPDYRDAYLELASLAYQLSRFSEAKNYLNQALNLDPNGTTVNKFSEAISAAP